MRKTFKSSSLCNISNFHNNVFFKSIEGSKITFWTNCVFPLIMLRKSILLKKVKSAFAVYVCIKLSVSYFILSSSNSWRKCPCYLKFGTHALKEMFLKTVCTFFMKLFVSKDNFLLTKLSTNQNWPKSIKFIIAKTICVLKKSTHVFSKVIIRKYSKL